MEIINKWPGSIYQIIVYLDIKDVFALMAVNKYLNELLTLAAQKLVSRLEIPAKLSNETIIKYKDYIQPERFFYRELH